MWGKKKRDWRASPVFYLKWASWCVPVVWGGPAGLLCFCATGVWTATLGRGAFQSAGLWFPFAAKIQGLLAHLHMPGMDTHTHTHTIKWKTLTHKCTFARARMKIQMDLMSLSIKFSLATVPPSALHADYRFWHLQSTIFANELYYRLILSKRFPAILYSTYIKLGNWQKTKTDRRHNVRREAAEDNFLTFLPFCMDKAPKMPKSPF